MTDPRSPDRVRAGPEERHHGRGVEVDASVEARRVEVAVRLAPGRVTAILGPNGAGKTTLVRLISGELRPDRGQVRIDGHRVAGPQIMLAPHRRTVALLAQRPLLFPHLRVLDNVAFGLRARGVARTVARERAERELTAVGAEGFARRWPSALSGGEAQRVALARALATDPSVVLLDEPLAAQDVDTAVGLRTLLARRLRGTAATIGLVTHDPLDVWALADDVVALEGGACVATGAVDAVLSRPPTRFLARLGGANLLHGTVRGEGLHTGADAVAGLWDPSLVAEEGRRGLATFPPSAVALFADRPHGSPRNTWTARVTSVEPRGAAVRVEARLGDGQVIGADLTAHGVAALGLTLDAPVIAQVKATQVTLYAR
ncbi:MAG: sulfate/molybdate ABC transporter ATP-binding protein [Propioniciclava sp.]